jgi:hypothetical protein
MREEAIARIGPQRQKKVEDIDLYNANVLNNSCVYHANLQMNTLLYVVSRCPSCWWYRHTHLGVLTPSTVSLFPTCTVRSVTRSTVDPVFCSHRISSPWWHSQKHQDHSNLFSIYDPWPRYINHTKLLIEMRLFVYISRNGLLRVGNFLLTAVQPRQYLTLYNPAVIHVPYDLSFKFSMFWLRIVLMSFLLCSKYTAICCCTATVPWSLYWYSLCFVMWEPNLCAP